MALMRKRLHTYAHDVCAWVYMTARTPILTRTVVALGVLPLTPASGGGVPLGLLSLPAPLCFAAWKSV